MKTWSFASILGFSLHLTSCSSMPAPNSNVLDTSNNREDLTTILKSWECPQNFELKVSLLEVNPLQRLANDAAYGKAVKALETLVASNRELKLKFGSRTFSNSVCTYQEEAGTLKATVHIRKRIEEQFDEDSPRFAEASFLSLRFFSKDQAADFRAVVGVTVESEGSPMVILNTSNNARTLMTKIPSENSQVKIGKYKISL